MPDEDKKIKFKFNLNVHELLDKIDRKALAGAIGLMLMSWAALPIIYFLLIRRKKEEEKGGNKKDGQ